MANNYSADRSSAHDSIFRFGRRMYLLRAGVARPCTGAVVNWRPVETQALASTTSRKAIISAQDLDVPPDHEQDQIIWEGELLRIAARPGRVAPAGVVIFWRMEVHDVGRAPGIFIDDTLVNSSSLGLLEIGEIS